MKLLCLSAGIDSVGALFHSISKGEDIVAVNLRVTLSKNSRLNLRPWMNNHSLQRELSKEICNRLSIKLMKVDINLDDIELSSQTPVHQKHILGSMCGMISLFNPEIDTCYHCSNYQDLYLPTYPLRTSFESVGDFQKAITGMGSTALGVTPIGHLTKQQVFDLIPKDFINLVSTCWFRTSRNETRCMTCLKCKQYDELLSESSVHMLNG